MINETELHQIKGLMHYLNNAEHATDLAFAVRIIDPNGDVLARLERVDGLEYQLLFGEHGV